MHALAAALLLAATITTIPPTPLIETTRTGQALNFDFLIVNEGKEPLEISQIEATVVTPDGALVQQHRLARNGQSVLTLPERTIPAGGKLVVFNPFPQYESDVALQKIRYEITFANDEKISIEVAPRRYENKTDLILPLAGRVFVHDGHDFYSHHRRLDITGGMTTALKIEANVTRYANDLTIVDAAGRMHTGDGSRNEDWFGFGTPVYAPGDGVVVKAANDRIDTAKNDPPPFAFEAVLKDITLIFGNYVILDHGHGEYSLLAHMKKGSVTVKAGDRVRQGQSIGAMGSSGDSLFPHLHYQLQSDAGMGEGLPSLFRAYKRFTGTQWVPVKRGSIDTGDVVESTAVRR